MTTQNPENLGKPLFEIDKKAKALFKPYRKTPPATVVDVVSKIADQPELRTVCAGLFILGVRRSDGRMVRASVRMIVVHESANFIKDMIKHRVDRRRPRSTGHGGASKPHKGRSREKEDQSFPSGHSAGSMAVACAYASVYPERAVPAVAAAAALSASRVVAAAHYPSDVAAGTAIGAATNGALGLALKGLRTVALAALRW